MKRILLGLLLLTSAAHAANDVVMPATPPPLTPPAPAAPPAATPSVTKWSGPVTQVGSDNGYWVNLTLTATGGTTYYPELNCGGTLKKIAESNGYTFYSESINTNREACIDGTITVSKIKGGLGWSWFGAKDEFIYVAYSSLAESK